MRMIESFHRTVFMKFRIIHFSLLSLLFASCVTVQQEQERVEREVAVLNQEIEEREYARIVEMRDEEFAGFRESLAQATKAAVVRERGDCCCTGAELAPVNDVPLSQEEFREMMSILTQAEPVPVVLREHFTPSRTLYAYRTDDGSWELDSRYNQPIICKYFGPIDYIKLMNAAGDKLFALDIDDGLDKVSNSAQYQAEHVERSGRVALLPDAAFERFEKHPALLRFKKRAKEADKL